MPDVGKVTLFLTAKTAQFERATKRAGEATNRLSEKLKGAAMQATATFAAMGFALSKVATKYATFQAGIVRTAALANVESKQQIAELEQTAIGLAKITKFTATEVTEAYKVLGMAGFDANKILGAIEPTLQLAAAGAVDLASAADITTGVMAGFGKSTEELVEVNDTLANAITSSKLNVATLGEAFKMVGPIAASAGISFKNTSSALAVLAQRNIDASLAGTALRRTLINVQAGSGKTKKLMTQLGLEFSSAGGKVKDFTGIIKELERAGITGKTVEEADILAQLFGARGMPAVVAMLAAGSKELEFFDERLSRVGTAAKITQAEMRSLDGRINAMKASIDGAYQAIGKRLEPAFRDTVNSIGAVADKISELNPKWIKLIGNAAITITKVAGATAVLSLLGAALLKLAGPIKLLGTAIGILGKLLGRGLMALLPVLPVILAVAAAIAGVTAAIGAGRKLWKFYEKDAKAAWEGVKTAISEAWTTIKEKGVLAAKAIMAAMIQVVQGIIGMFKGVGAVVGQIVERIAAKDFAGAMNLEDISATFKAEREAVAKETELMIAALEKEGIGFSALEGMGDEIAKQAKKGFKAAQKQAGETLNWVKESGKEYVLDPLTESFQEAFDLMGPMAEKAMTKLKTIFEEMGLKLPPLFTGGAGGIAKKKPGTTEDPTAAAARAMAAEAVEGQSSGRAQAMGQAAAGAVSGPVGSIIQGGVSGGWFGALMSTVSEIIQNSKPLQKIFKVLGDLFLQFVGATNGLFASLEPLIVIFGEVISKIVVALAPLLDAIGDVLRPILVALMPIIGLVLVLVPVLEGLTGVLKLLTPVVEGLAWVVFQVFTGIARTWNEIVKALSDFLRWMGNIGKDIPLIGSTFKKMLEVADRMEAAAQIHIRSWEGANSSITEFADETERATGAMLNVPQVLKLSLARYRSIKGEGGVSRTTADSPATEAVKMLTDSVAIVTTATGQMITDVTGALADAAIDTAMGIAALPETLASIMTESGGLALASGAGLTPTPGFLEGTGSAAGTNIENVTVNVQELTTTEQLTELMEQLAFEASAQTPPNQPQPAGSGGGSGSATAPDFGGGLPIPGVA